MRKIAVLVSLVVLLSVGMTPVSNATGSCSIRTTATKLSDGRLRGVATVTCSSSHFGGEIGVYVYKNGSLVASKTWYGSSAAWSQVAVPTTSVTTCKAPATFYAIGYGLGWKWSGYTHGYISDSTSTKAC